MQLQINFDNRERYFPRDLNTFSPSTSTPPENAPETLIINYHRRSLENGLTWLYYILFYVQDDGLGSFHLDAHPWDWEVVVAEMDDTDTLLRLCYTPHGSKEHFWLSKEDTQTLLKKTGGTIPIYCSRGKHATYPMGGTIWRYGGFANDTNNSRIVYNHPTLVELSVDSPYFAPKKGFLSNPLNYPTIPLHKVRTRLLFEPLWQKCVDNCLSFIKRL